MHYETIKTQMKIAELLHNRCLDTGTLGSHDLESCRIKRTWVVVSAGFLGKLMPTIVEEIVSQVREDERAKVAEHIRAELVCCDLYEQIDSARPAQFSMTEKAWGQMDGESVANLLGLNYHDICHWGGYAAALAGATPAGHEEVQRQCEQMERQARVSLEIAERAQDQRAEMRAERDAYRREAEQARELLHEAWGVIANAENFKHTLRCDASHCVEGDHILDPDSPVPIGPQEWRDAAYRWRDRFHAAIDADHIIAAHTHRGPKATDPDRQHPAHDGQTCEEYEAAGAGDGEQDATCGYMYVTPIATFTCDKPRGHGTVHRDSAEMFMWTDDAVGNTPPADAAPDADSAVKAAAMKEPDRIIPPMRLDELEQICRDARAAGSGETPDGEVILA